MNSVHLIGRLTAAPTIKHLNDSRAVAEATIAVDDPFARKDAAGNKKAHFFALVFWSPKAEVAAAHLVKGQRIGISGRLTQESFIPQGQTIPVTKTRIVVESFDFLDKPAGAPLTAPASTHDSQADTAANLPPDDNIPY